MLSLLVGKVLSVVAGKGVVLLGGAAVMLFITTQANNCKHDLQAGAIAKVELQRVAQINQENEKFYAAQEARAKKAERQAKAAQKRVLEFQDSLERAIPEQGGSEPEACPLNCILPKGVLPQ